LTHRSKTADGRATLISKSPFPVHRAITVSHLNPAVKGFHFCRMGVKETAGNTLIIFMTDKANPCAEVIRHFEDMIDHCYDFAESAKAGGRRIVGIMCEFTPREVILAAGAVPVCLCGGSAATIPDAEQVLPANLCPLIKSTYGYHVKGANPFLKWADLVVAETTCDGKKKMFELMGATKPMHVLELPQKSNDATARANWIAEVRKFKDQLAKRFNVEITDNALREAIVLMNCERTYRRRLASWMKQDLPPMTGRQLLDFKSIISGIEADLRHYEQALDLLEGGAAMPGSPKATGRRPVRVLLTGVPMAHGAERVMDLIEKAGATVVCMETCTGLKPILEDVNPADPDPIRAIADKYYHLPCSVMTLNEDRFKSIKTLAAEYRPDCVIELVWQACLTYDVESIRVRAMVETELHLPYLKITTDYSPSDSARIEARIQALVEMTGVS
jgi:benzoyl-CoA reductase/2-hydroxyglutaryl-CoA dehydratase subunit BcrC/BadD/HgdB